MKTFAQAAVALLTGDGLNLLTVDWKNVVSVGPPVAQGAHPGHRTRGRGHGAGGQVT